MNEWIKDYLNKNIKREHKRWNHQLLQLFPFIDSCTMHLSLDVLFAFVLMLCTENKNNNHFKKILRLSEDPHCIQYSTTPHYTCIGYAQLVLTMQLLAFVRREL
ncbi:hypothetical protein PHYBLDRAFT_173665 [Phycomyces blakesleeanus NRRL 1555(-)]|uniref:Uncharacterized protein n=1 Tax=Phycomyces blakesleeanus (strain ATCC 8743b / DSM 1359 / FGSC 10004 / NBRC 33097 / NRRL 1555) TaxID=763407 RepID=A0A167KIC5_PHYB8|nr:hypothetical protein PHYBLDRAFT_173665 [Phycomyces blakesleeanus NRRL 1555(-)]OAD68175.1 hypothetical protein PHYBLDRAFT_173665 [Phycomyces blakesleeanus NRRL 1555(-)]|eukprot:XP_018286215.1 hypothetical protein PHYBLDRAFT_173665 [Phycomyces blakesleeanus NRRL 1555(-)]